MSWMAEMSSYRYLGELKRRCAQADAAAERQASEPEPSSHASARPDAVAERPASEAEPSSDASARPDAAAGDSPHQPTAARPLESASSTA